MLERIKNFFYTFLRKNTNQQQRYLGYWWEKKKLIPINDEQKFFSIDYENYLKKILAKQKVYLGIFPKKIK